MIGNIGRKRLKNIVKGIYKLENQKNSNSNNNNNKIIKDKFKNKIINNKFKIIIQMVYKWVYK